jgi:hypothetical protein
MNKPRYACDHNFAELIIPILLLHAEIQSHTDPMDYIDNPSTYSKIRCDEYDLLRYKEDILRKREILPNYIKTFREKLKFIDTSLIDQIFISGKTNKHPEIKRLNETIDKKSAKSDFYIRYKDETMIGVSVKQSQHATKSNYSVHKLCMDKETSNQITSEKKSYLKNNGFTSFNKLQRSDINKLFYPQNKTNPYWARIREQIAQNKSSIIHSLTQLLFCSTVPYDIYEFDGNDFIKLNIVYDESTVTFEEYEPYYLDSTGVLRESAKLFYRLTVGEKIFRVEIRWKGNVYNASPQFQIHSE